MGLKNIRTLSKGSNNLAITVKQGKAHCFIDEDDNTQDEFIAQLISTAQSIIENDPLVPYCFFSKKFEAIFEQEKSRILLPKSPVSAVEKVEEFDGKEWFDVDASTYTVELGDDFGYVILPYCKGQKRKLKITFEAGNASSDEIRQDIKQAVAYLLAHLYEYRGASTSLNIYDNPVYKAIISRLRRIL